MKTSFLKWMTVIAVVCMTSSVWADGVDVTDKLVNADGEDRMQGWSVDFTIEDGFKGYTWASNSHTEQAYRDEGYWGMKSRIFELWNSSQIIPGPNSIHQDLAGLPNGTYVFGAFALGVRSGYDVSNPQDYLESQGVYMFANADEAPVATNAPSSTYSWGHGRKVNVATTVTDGTLRVGMGLKENATAFWAAFDNATLYYFKDASVEAALTEMRKIDVDFDNTVVDSLKKYSMSAECYADLLSAVAFGQAATQLAEYEAADDSIRICCMRARRSISDFKKLTDLLSKAKEVAADNWSEMVKEQIRLLNISIEKIEKELLNHAISSDDLDNYISKLSYDMDMVRIDRLWDAIDMLDLFLLFPEEISEENPCFGITAHPGFGDGPGQYSLDWFDKLEFLFDETNNMLADIEIGVISPSVGFAQITKIENAVADCINSANLYVTFPYELILMHDENDPSIPFESNHAWDYPFFMDNYYTKEGWTNGGECLHVESPIIYTEDDIDVIEISVINCLLTRYATTNDGPYFGIQEFYLFDGQGNRVELTAADFLVNPIDPTYPESNLCDNNLSTLCHSRWSAGQIDYGPHKLTITLPEPLSSFRFVYENQWNSNRIIVAPTKVSIVGMSKVRGNLATAVSNASQYGTTPGKDPGFYGEPNPDFAVALENAQKVLADPESTSADYTAAYEALTLQFAINAEKTFNLPEPEKEYTISCKYSGYLNNQNKMKALSVMQDSLAWWEDADPANKYQHWTFEPAENTYGDDEIYYYIKNVQTGNYLGTYHNEMGYDENGNPFSWSSSWYVKMSDEPVAWRLSNIGSGQFNLINYCLLKNEWLTLHTENHNNGYASSNVTNHVGIYGVSGALVYWGDPMPYGYSSWAINEMEVLPISVLIGNDTTDKCYHFSAGSNIFTFTADKACAFTNFKMLDECYQEIAIQMKQTANILTVTLPKTYADFYFSFDNIEGVQNVTIDISTGEKSKLDLLQEAYNAVDKRFVEGTDVGCVKDLSAFRKAMANAEVLLENGGTDDEIVAAIAAIDAAVEELEVIQPQAGKRYFIIAAYSGNYDNFGGDVAICYFSSISKPGWTFINKNSDDFVWEFVPAESEGLWYLKNVTSGLFLGSKDNNGKVVMSEIGVPYEVLSAFGGSINLHCLAEGNDASWTIHQNGWNWNQSFNGLIYWEDCEQSRWFIREYNDDVSVESLMTDPISVQQEGIFDLFGRRVAAPEKGLYIVGGKKVLYK
ncbi:MAG: RICIN domain-containing protein [Bacteroidaceae bacterium]|nr:RICIN domain-containing protein [Bacteroidaceae bacterium]